MTKKDLGGRPLLFKTVEELETAIGKYFDKCDVRMKERVTKDGQIVHVNDPEPYTMSGLAYALGINRRTLIHYEERDKFSLTIKKAREKVEADVERRMSDRDTFTPGLIFNAKNNFGWVDQQDIKTEGEIKIVSETI